MASAGILLRVLNCSRVVSRFSFIAINGLWGVVSANTDVAIVHAMKAVNNNILKRRWNLSVCTGLARVLLNKKGCSCKEFNRAQSAGEDGRPVAESQF